MVFGLIGLLFFILILIIFYSVIKAAVRDGINESKLVSKKTPPLKESEKINPN
ncbi:hypothetical protein [Vagococcus salmoninarum]|uniref:hypothetical protein n=1 Tax=Vagococcus salmoninarum TaxID=2739 RepID=UPI003F955B18